MDKESEFFYREEIYEKITKLPDFELERIKKIATKLLLSYGGEIVPVDVFKLAEFLGIRVIKYSEAPEITENPQLSDGFWTTVVDNGKLFPYIFYNDFKNLQRIRFTILHEIGHFFFKHLEHSDLAEATANFFAKYIIAPPPLVSFYSIHNSAQLASKFDVSQECARNSFHYYQKWRSHHTKESLKPYELDLLQRQIFGNTHLFGRL